MKSFTQMCVLMFTLCFWSSVVSGVPETVTIQGNLEAPGGGPVSGTRTYSLGFYDAAVAGSVLASETGMVTISETGRFSIEVTLPPVVLSATQAWYELAIDIEGNGLDASDLFPERVRIHSVPFALHAHSADTARSATSALTAEGFSGALNNPGDRIPMGDNVFFEVGPDGKVEFVVDGRRFRLAERRWFDPKKLFESFSPADSSNRLPKVAVNDRGEALIVWRSLDAGGTMLYRSEYRNGTWKDPSGPLDSFAPVTDGIFAIDVALNNNGEAVIVFSGSVEGDNLLYRSEYRNGEWVDPDLGDHISFTGSNAVAPDLAISDNGDAVIVWYQTDSLDPSGRLAIFRSEYRDGSWSDPTSRSDNLSPDGQNASLPKVAMNDQGEAVIVWRQFTGANQQLYRSEYRGGAWVGPSDIADNFSPDGSDVDRPHVAMNDAGEVVIVWQQWRTISTEIFRSEYRNGSWSDPTDLLDNVSISGRDASSPKVDLNDNGESIIVWTQFMDGVEERVFRSEYKDGVWIDPGPLDHISPTGSSAFDAQISLNNSGEALIVWRQSDGANEQVFRSFRKDEVWDDPSSLSDNISPDGQSVDTTSPGPQGALSNSGEGTIVWSQKDGVWRHILRSEYRFGF